MADDILERIRSRPNDAPMPTERLLDEAADEIERLRKALDTLDKNLQLQQWSIRVTLGTLRTGHGD